jgi:hypothetical protein
MALLALEKAPFSAICLSPIRGAGQPGPRDEHRDWGRREERRTSRDVRLTRLFSKGLCALIKNAAALRATPNEDNPGHQNAPNEPTAAREDGHGSIGRYRCGALASMHAGPIVDFRGAKVDYGLLPAKRLVRIVPENVPDATNVGHAGAPKQLCRGGLRSGNKAGSIFAKRTHFRSRSAVGQLRLRMYEPIAQRCRGGCAETPIARVIRSPRYELRDWHHRPGSPRIANRMHPGFRGPVSSLVC